MADARADGASAEPPIRATDATWRPHVTAARPAETAISSTHPKPNVSIYP
ncbi:hypothetical protein OH687_35150 [Burkholderia anthina]|nr:hypothetical protein OH687_35150 [Burkholderia anthina]